jgi:hypothetical protein
MKTISAYTFSLLIQKKSHVGDDYASFWKRQSAHMVENEKYSSYEFHHSMKELNGTIRVSKGILLGK